MKKILVLFLGIVLSISSLAKESQKRWPYELYSNVHPTSQGNRAMEIMEAEDYVKALQYAEEHLLQKDLKSMDAEEFAKEITSIARLLTDQHLVVAEIQDLGTFYRILTATKVLIGGSLGFSAWSMLNLPENHMFHSIWTASLVYDYSLVSKESSERREVKIRRKLGKKYEKFVRNFEKAIRAGKRWTYPGIVTFIPHHKPSSEVLLNFAKRLLERFQNEETFKDEASALEYAYETSAFAHEEWVRLHLLKDGNGRMGRLLANLILVKAGIEPLIVTDDATYTVATVKGLEKASDEELVNLGEFVSYLKRSTRPKKVEETSDRSAEL